MISPAHLILPAFRSDQSSLIPFNSNPSSYYTACTTTALGLAKAPFRPFPIISSNLHLFPFGWNLLCTTNIVLKSVSGVIIDGSEVWDKDTTFRSVDSVSFSPFFHLYFCFVKAVLPSTVSRKQVKDSKDFNSDPHVLSPEGRMGTFVDYYSYHSDASTGLNHGLITT